MSNSLINRIVTTADCNMRKNNFEFFVNIFSKHKGNNIYMSNTFYHIIEFRMNFLY